MAPRNDSLVADTDQVRQMIEQRLVEGRNYWRPLHARMDRWFGMYLMQDVIQQMKPVGHRRFVSNEPHTAIDLGVSILTRNDSFWRIALFEDGNQNADERRFIGTIERALQGLIYDIDEIFSMRLKQRFWKQAAQQALLRGWIWGKAHVTTEALKYFDTPIFADFYDPRMVYPHADQLGLAWVVIESQTTAGDLAAMYPDKFGEKVQGAAFDPFAPATKIEYWSNDRGERKGINAVLASIQPLDTSQVFVAGGDTQTMIGHSHFIIPPYFHGYSYKSLPIVGVPVNGLNLQTRPQLGGIIVDRMRQQAELIGSQSPYNWWYGPNTWVADTGRSILAAVEEHVPQYNELIATILQHLGVSAFGTWSFTSPRGELPRHKPGVESIIPLTPDERLDRIEVGPINADAMRLVDIIGDEKQNGMLANILRAQNVSGDPSGVLFQQMANAALNALEPFQDGMEEFGQRIGTSILAQLQEAAGVLKPFEVASPSSPSATKRQSYFVMEFDPKELAKRKRQLRARPVFKPALPDDLAIRINAARAALDPRRPILSLSTVLEHILQVEDPTDEIDRIWEDIATNDPIIVLEQISAALERLGEQDLAKRIQEKQFRAAFTEELAFRQTTGGAMPQPGQMENLPPEAGANSFATARTGESANAGMGQASASLNAGDGARGGI